MTTAPTLAEILLKQATVTLSCDACRVLEAPDTVDLMARLGSRLGPDVPIDRIKFTCQRLRQGAACRQRLKPFVHGPGNNLLGFPQLWPPVTEGKTPG